MAYQINIHIRPAIIAIFIFLIGLMIGIAIDNYRVSQVRKTISESEIRWNDALLLNQHLEKLGNISCDLALDENLKYNDAIYTYGKQIEKTIEATTFTPELEQEWTRYNLLQVQFWFNSIELKERCGFDYHNVVYISREKSTTNGEKIDNKLQSSILLNLKEKCGNKIMLIPLTADVDLIVTDSVIKQFDIIEYPSVIIDEKYVFQGLTTIEELENIVKC
jgi:hypothetical protein